MASSAPSVASASSVTPELATAIAEAQAALSAAYRECPIQDEVVANPDADIEHIQNWAFCEHFAIAVSSCSATQVHLQCIVTSLYRDSKHAQDRT